MINVYSDLISYSGDNWEDYLTRICLIDIFKDLIPLFNDKEELTQAIRYVVWAYSKNSDADHLGGDWLKIKKRIFDKTLLPNEYHNELVLFKNDDYPERIKTITKVIQAWIDFQDENVYANLTSLRDLMIEMRLSSNSKILKSSGEIDYSQKFLNATYVQDLGKMIKDLEQELVQNDVKLKEGVREIKRSTRDNTMIGVERYAV